MKHLDVPFLESKRRLVNILWPNHSKPSVAWLLESLFAERIAHDFVMHNPATLGEL